MIDPGHGGRFPGTVGRGGTREADVNLGVALRLAGLLRDAGAEVLLTRTDDVDLILPDGEPILQRDLRARVEISNAARANLFLSIHHNARPGVARGFNRIETYYSMSDPGPSLDVGRNIHQHLVRNLGIRENRLVPGNYYVLRNNRCPAVLGEACYLSNPGMERKLKREEKQLLEAQSYFLGIVDYFQRGVPRLAELWPARDERIGEDRPVISAIVQDDEGGKGVDPQSIVLAVDGQPVLPCYFSETGRIVYLPPKPFSNGEHTIELTFRNLRGNEVYPVRSRFTVARPPASISLNTSSEMVPSDGRSRAMISAYVTDHSGNPVLDGMEVRFDTEESNSLLRYTQGGTAQIYLTSNKAGRIRVTATCGGVSREGEARFGHIAGTLLIVHVKNIRDGKPTEGVFLSVDHIVLGDTNADGYVAMDDLPTGVRDLRATREGYIPYCEPVEILRREATSLEIGLEPVAEGLLHGRRVAIDPASSPATGLEGLWTGGRPPARWASLRAWRLSEPEASPVGSSGISSSEVNLKVAKYLADYLIRAGARVVLTRDRDAEITPFQRVQIASETKAELFLSISYGLNSPKRAQSFIRTGHYPGSQEGMTLARAIQRELVSCLDGRDDRVHPDVSYVVQHTPCPAVSISLSSASDPKETALREPSYLRRVAYAVYEGVLKYYGAVGSASLDGRVVDISGDPIRDVLVLVDRYLPVQTDEAGRFHLGCLPPRSHTLAFRTGGDRLLERKVDLEEGTNEVQVRLSEIE